MIGLWVVVIWKHGDKSKNLATDYTAQLIALKKFIANGPHNLSPICTPSGIPLLNSILIQTYRVQLLYIEMSLNISWLLHVPQKTKLFVHHDHHSKMPKEAS